MLQQQEHACGCAPPAGLSWRVRISAPPSHYEAQAKKAAEGGAGTGINSLLRDRLAARMAGRAHDGAKESKAACLCVSNVYCTTGGMRIYMLCQRPQGSELLFLPLLHA